MANIQTSVPPYRRVPTPGDDVLLHEANHRCGNDLQLVVSLLSLQASRARSEETRDALTDAMERVAVLARSRATMQQHDLTLGTALRQLCDALSAHTEPRSILVSLRMGRDDYGLSVSQVTTLALVVNELATNAIKHAFEERVDGHIRVSVENDDDTLTVFVDDDGLPFPELDQPNSLGFGLNLVKRMVASIGGLIIIPADGTKVFQIRVPLTSR